MYHLLLKKYYILRERESVMKVVIFILLVTNYEREQNEISQYDEAQ